MSFHFSPLLGTPTISDTISSIDSISSFGSVEVSGSPFAPQCSASGHGLTTGTVGMKSEFPILLHTKDGKPYTKNTTSPVVSIQSPQGNILPESDNIDNCFCFRCQWQRKQKQLSILSRYACRTMPTFSCTCARRILEREFCSSTSRTSHDLHHARRSTYPNLIK